MTSESAERRWKFLGCEIFFREACALAARCERVVDVEFLRKGLHDLETADMVATVQKHIDAVDAELYDAVLLGYARCNDGLVGIAARDLPLVLPRAHDCITAFFGSRQAYQEYFDEHPGTYFLTTGWAERNREFDGNMVQSAYGMEGVMAKLGLTESYEELLARHGKENADYIIETLGGWERAYSRLCYLEMGACEEGPFLDSARQRAAEKGWTFEHRRGDWTLLEKLFGGQWEEEFLIVQPGQTVVARNDASILDAE